MKLNKLIVWWKTVRKLIDELERLRYCDLVIIGLIVTKKSRIRHYHVKITLVASLRPLGSPWHPLKSCSSYKSVKCLVSHHTIKNTVTHALGTNNQGHLSACILHVWRCDRTHKCISTQCLVTTDQESVN